MKKPSNPLLLIAVCAVCILILILAIRILSGAIHLVSGAFNTVLGRVVILALIAIVIWMFAYAKKKK